jgi:hypothetical protein
MSPEEKQPRKSERINDPIAILIASLEQIYNSLRTQQGGIGLTCRYRSQNTSAYVRFSIVRNIGDGDLLSRWFVVFVLIYTDIPTNNWVDCRDMYHARINAAFLKKQRRKELIFSFITPRCFVQAHEV